jgi:mannose-6-phosphate isomerase
MEAVARSRPAIGRRLLILEPQYRERVWGGRRLRPAEPPIGEAWIAFGASRVRNGPFAGATLDDLVAAQGQALLGTSAMARYGARFPLLVKLLDCADWLSLQVHPNDEQARRMVGPDAFGKTEAWYFLDTDPPARILLGVKPGTTAAALAGAMRAGRVVDVAEEVAVHAGEAVLIPAGTLHALGPGLFIYEIQQASDTTYRVYDWDRPQTAGRKLHIEESIEVTAPVGPLSLRTPETGAGTASACAIECDKFELQLCSVGETPLRSDTAGLSFHILTSIEGAVELGCGRETVRLETYDTALVTAAAGRYEIRALSRPARLLRARVPDGSAVAFCPDRP